MQVVLAVVLGEGVGGAVEREFSVGDPVCIAADGAAEISFVGDIAVQGVIAQQNVGKPAVAVRRLEADERRAKVGDGHLHTVAIAQNKYLHVPAVRSLAKRASL